MKRFLVFIFEPYYPRGGFEDFYSAHDTLEAAQQSRQTNHTDYTISHIVDLTTLKIIESQQGFLPLSQSPR
jgi:hypothetical protein